MERISRDDAGEIWFAMANDDSLSVAVEDIKTAQLHRTRRICLSYIDSVAYAGPSTASSTMLPCFISNGSQLAEREACGRGKDCDESVAQSQAQGIENNVT